jgi:hypothetical protein
VVDLGMAADMGQDPETPDLKSATLSRKKCGAVYPALVTL